MAIDTSQVRRVDTVIDLGGACRIQPLSSGRFVHHSDYVALSAERDALQASDLDIAYEMNAWKSRLNNQAGTITRLQADNAKLRAEVEGLRGALQWVRNDLSYRPPETVATHVRDHLQSRIAAALTSTGGDQNG